MKSKPERFRVKLPGLKAALPPRLTWLGDINRLLLDPDLNPQHLGEMLDVLPFLTDAVVVVDPSPKNLRRWHYDVSRFSELVDHRVFLPLFSADKCGLYKTEIERTDLFEDDEFWAEYESAIERDFEDAKFCHLAKRLEVDPHDAAFSMNWDLINSQILNAPIVSAKRFRPLLQYKVLNNIRDLENSLDSSQTTDKVYRLKQFLYRALGVLPSGLNVSQLIEFRKDNRAQRFRKWFNDELRNAAEASKIAKIPFNQKIYDDFLELARSYDKRAGKITASLSAVVGIAGSALGAIVGGPAGAALGAAPSALGAYTFSGILNRVWQRKSRNNWVFLFLDVRHEQRAL